MPTIGERLLTIGEFSRLSQLSVRMLRYYDEHDVLHPSRVEGHSGYRSYAPTLLFVARRVRELRDIGLGVHEIAACVSILDDPHAVRAVLERQRTRLIAEAANVVDRVRELDHLITSLEGPVMSITITHRTHPARITASVRDVIATYADEGRLWERLMPALSAAGATPAPDARCIAILHDEEYRESDCDVEVQLDVTAAFAGSGDVRCVTVPEQEVAVAALDGPYDGIGAVMEAVGRWVPENGYRFAGPMFNVYLLSRREDPDPNHWVTQVCVPVARLAPSNVLGAASADAR